MLKRKKKPSSLESAKGFGNFLYKGAVRTVEAIKKVDTTASKFRTKNKQFEIDLLRNEKKQLKEEMKLLKLRKQVKALHDKQEVNMGLL